MAKKLEKILTQEQKDNIILFAYNMIIDGNQLVFVDERQIVSENNNYICQIKTTMLGNGKEIFLMYITNKTTNKKIKLDVRDMVKTNISTQLAYIQHEVNDLIDQNTPVYYTDDEIEDIIGDPTVLGKRRVKVGHLIGNIIGKKKIKQ